MDKELETKQNQISGKGEDIPFYKHQEFAMYRVWYSLPAFMKGKDATFLKEKMGFEDDTMVELLQIRTQAEFAKKYSVNLGQLSTWNKYIDANYDPFQEIKAWSQKLIKNVVNATYNSSLQRDPKANADRKLFLQLQGWVEETKQVHKVENFTDLIRGALNNGSRKGTVSEGEQDKNTTGPGVVSPINPGNGAVGEASGDNQQGQGQSEGNSPQL